MKAGDLDRRVTLQRATDTVDAYGGITTAWVTLADVWARIAPLSARELVSSAQIQGQTQTKITIRFRTGVTNSNIRILHPLSEQEGSPTPVTIYDVQAVLPSEDRKRFITFLCKSGTNDG